MIGTKTAPEPWKVRRMPGKRCIYQVCSYENPGKVEVLDLAWTDIKKAQDFADAANKMYNIGKGGVAV